MYGFQYSSGLPLTVVDDDGCGGFMIGNVSRVCFVTLMEAAREMVVRS